VADASALYGVDRMPMTLERVEIAAEAMAGKAVVMDASEARDTMAESDPVAAEEYYVKLLSLLQKHR
jgi:hypothetical protein